MLSYSCRFAMALQAVVVFMLPLVKVSDFNAMVFPSNSTDTLLSTITRGLSLSLSTPDANPVPSKMAFNALVQQSLLPSQQPRAASSPKDALCLAYQVFGPQGMLDSNHLGDIATSIDVIYDRPGSTLAPLAAPFMSKRCILLKGTSRLFYERPKVAPTHLAVWKKPKCLTHQVFRSHGMEELNKDLSTNIDAVYNHPGSTTAPLAVPSTNVTCIEWSKPFVPKFNASAHAARMERFQQIPIVEMVPSVAHNEESSTFEGFVQLHSEVFASSAVARGYERFVSFARTFRNRMTNEMAYHSKEASEFFTKGLIYMMLFKLVWIIGVMLDEKNDLGGWVLTCLELACFVGMTTGNVCKIFLTFAFFLGLRPFCFETIEMKVIMIVKQCLMEVASRVESFLAKIGARLLQVKVIGWTYRTICFWLFLPIRCIKKYLHVQRVVVFWLLKLIFGPGVFALENKWVIVVPQDDFYHKSMAVQRLIMKFIDDMKLEKPPDFSVKGIKSYMCEFNLVGKTDYGRRSNLNVTVVVKDIQVPITITHEYCGLIARNVFGLREPYTQPISRPEYVAEIMFLEGNGDDVGIIEL